MKDLGPLPERVNVAQRLRDTARRDPDGRGVIEPTRHGWRTTTFAELEARSDAIAHGLADAGLRRGDRVSVFLRPGVELVAVTWALYKLGAIPVLIDPGMGRRALLSAIEKAAPRGLVAVPLARAIQTVFPRAFRSIEVAVTHGPWPRGPRLAELERRGASRGAFPIADTAATDGAAVLFTSGSTGPPKGVAYTHRNFDAQVRALDATYAFTPGEIDVAGFPLFALFDAALGTTSVFPRLDPSRPGRCDPALVVSAIQDHDATYAFGSPAIWRRVVPWCEATGTRLPTLRRVLIAGAPVPPSLIERLIALLDDAGDVHTPYGATEALPVSSISGRTVLAETRARTEAGAGTCVGRPVDGIDLRLIAIDDGPIGRWSDAREVADGELGEICVRGPVVTGSYLFEPEPTRAAKIAADTEPGTAAGVWHRMGDIGYRDDDGRIWFCGRKTHRLETGAGLVMPVPAENVFDLHPAVRKTALVGVGPRGRERPALVVQPERRVPPRGPERTRLVGEILDLARTRPVDERARPTESDVLFRELPVDVRHNAKIRREALKPWAEARLG